MLRGKPQTIGSGTYFFSHKSIVHGWDSSLPEGSVGLAQRLFPREAELIEQLLAIGDIAQEGTFPVACAPARPFVQQRDGPSWPGAGLMTVDCGSASKPAERIGNAEMR